MSFEEYFWGADQGYQYRRFDKLRVSYYTIQTFRLVGAAVILFWCFIGINFSGDGNAYLCFMTTWGGYFALFQLLLNFFAAHDQKHNPGEVSGWKFTIWRTSVWFTPLSLCFQVVITILYWAFLNAEDSKEIDWRHYYLIFIHSMPFTFTIIEFFMQKMWFRKQHYLATLIATLIYAPVNYIGCQLKGSPLYPILTWDPIWLSIIICIAGFVIFRYIFEGYVKLTEILNHPRLKGYYLHNTNERLIAPATCAQDVEINSQQNQFRIVYIPVAQV